MKLASIFVSLVLPAALAAPAFAQTVDHPSCAPWKAKWTEASTGADLAAIDDVIGKIPMLCANLKAEAAAGRAAAVKKAEQSRLAAAQQKAALEAAQRANDPCLQARNDWSFVQTASEDMVRTYYNSTPASCPIWRKQAEARLDMFVAQRVAAKKAADEAAARQRADAEAARKAFETEAEAERERLEAKRIADATAAALEKQRLAQQQERDTQHVIDLTHAAKRAGIEGRWHAFDINRPGSKCPAAGNANGILQISIGDGIVIYSVGAAPPVTEKIVGADINGVVTDKGVTLWRRVVSARNGATTTVVTRSYPNGSSFDHQECK